MTHINVNFEAFLVAGVRAPKEVMQFIKPFNIYIERSRTHTDEECSHCLGQARDLLRKVEKAAGVHIVPKGTDLSLEDMGVVCTMLDQEASKLSKAQTM